MRATNIGGIKFKTFKIASDYICILSLAKGVGQYAFFVAKTECITYIYILYYQSSINFQLTWLDILIFSIK